MKSSWFNKGRILLITASIVVIVALCAGLLFFALQKTSSPNNNDADEVVRSAEDAVAELKKLGDDLGYKNALSELTEKATTTVDGDTYYRLQQNYLGIPVYGRTVVCVTDENGKAIAITGNVIDVGEKIDVVPTASMEQLTTKIATYAVDELGFAVDACATSILSHELVWYVDSSGHTALAYCVLAYIGEDPYEVVVDANTGDVYAVSYQMMTESVSVSISVDGYEHEINLWQEDGGSYITYDAENNIRVLSANGETLVKVLVFELATGEKYRYNCYTESWYDECGTACTMPTDPYVSLTIEFTTEENLVGVTQPTFADLEILDQDACRMLFFTTIANDYFSQVLSRDGWGDGNTTTLQVVFDCANGSYHYSPEYGVSMLSIEGGSSLNTVAHELTHAMESTESGMTYSGESGAIMEALSDIFAEIVEYDFLGACDWLYDSGLRNLVDPSLSTESNMAHPSMYKGKNWYSGSQDNGGVHINSTVISHAAYLMSEDGGGLLAMDELAKLWYRAMLMMPSDCDFEECRTLVELAATSMGLSDAQIACVKEAFDTVGINNGETVDYELSSSATLSVYGADANLYSNYTMQIAGTQTIGNQDADPTTDDIYNYYIYFRQNTTTEKYYETRHITTTEPVSLDLKYGTYTITLIDDEGSGTSVSFKIKVGTQDGKDNIAIYTDFSKPDISTDKQLSRIVRYDEYTDALGYCYELSYNDKNQLVGLTQGQASSDTKHDPTFTYSPDGKLLWIITGEPTDAYAPGYNSGCGYEYNSSGQLTRTFAWEGGYVEKKYKYDPEEKCVSSVENGDFYTTTETHVYGADGTRLYSEVDTTFSDGHIERYVVEYDYSYEPFVLKRREDTGWKVLALQIDDNISVLNFFFTEEVQFYIDADGYLEKAETDGETYYFFYNDNEEKDIDSFASVVEQRIEKCAFYSLSDDQQQVCRGLLYDLDEDGQDELILQYLNGSGYDLEIWNNIRGNVACVCSAITDDGLSYQNLGVGVGLGAYNGERYLVWFWEYADEMRSNNTNFIKEKELIYKITNGNYEYNDILETSELEHISDIIGVAYPYYSGGMSLSELLAYLLGG